MAYLWSIVLCMAAVASADFVIEPSNSSASLFKTQLKITSPVNLSLPTSYEIAPITPATGQGQSQAAVDVFGWDANLVVATGDSTQQPIGPGDFAYINCGEYAGQINASSVFQNVADLKPIAIILYSTTTPRCDYSGDLPFKTLYTMTSSTDSQNLLLITQKTSGGLATRLGKGVTDQSNNMSNQNNNNNNNNNGGPAPTTAVAMSILYSITGIITLLFLVIIATGAIRAHRHPERYGPRAGNTGRPRQSRAKGLARAMLETLPIVKFGDPEPVKSGSRDIELEDGTNSVHSQPRETEATGALKAIPAGAVVESGMNDNTHGTSVSSGQEPAGGDGELGCSICTEDFTTGEDVRVLPCKHKYHPACIDPWLLNVSGTCPLCRHDLRPTPVEGASAEGDELPPPLSPAEGEGAAVVPEASNPQRRRVSRFLDLHRLRTAPPAERIAALRQLREQSQRDGETETTAETAAETSRPGLSSRLRDTFRIRTRRQNEQPTAPQTE